MNSRMSNSAVRWAVVAVVAAASGVLGYAGARNAIIQNWTASSNPDLWLRAAELEPSDADNWYRLGRYRQLDFEHGDLSLAISYYQRAIAINPASAPYWMDLADVYETLGNPGQVEQAFRTAQQVYPISGEVAWRFGNFLLRQDRVDEAFEQIRHAISMDPELTALAVSRCWRSTQDIDRILQFALPAKPEAYWGAIDFFVSAREQDAAMAVWKRLTADGTSFPISKAFPLLDVLMGSGNVADATTMWQQALATAGIQSATSPPGSLMWDGSFEGELLNGGFAWRYRPADNADVSFDTGNVHPGNRSLRVVFDGTANIKFEHLWQYVAAEPNTRYRFSAYIQTRDLTTDSGIRFQIVDASHPDNFSQFTPDPARLTPNVLGTQPWALDDVEFTTGPQTRLLRIALVRARSNKLANRIRGTGWVDDVSLHPLPPTGPAGQ